MPRKPSNPCHDSLDDKESDDVREAVLDFLRLLSAAVVQNVRQKSQSTPRPAERDQGGSQKSRRL
jgi:hypothetical protein